MKQIKKVVLKEAIKLSQEEMKYVFGGSSAEQTISGCYLKCGNDFILSNEISGCNICYASGGNMFCKENVEDVFQQYRCPSGI